MPQLPWWEASATNPAVSSPDLKICQAEGSQSAECEGAQFENQVPAWSLRGKVAPNRYFKHQEFGSWWDHCFNGWCHSEKGNTHLIYAELSI